MQLKAKDIPNFVGIAGDLTVSGKITRVFDKKSGESEKGKWSFQNFILTDDTGECTVCYKNRPETLEPSDVDKTITISSTKTQNGILGVKVEEDSYEKDGETKTSLKVIVTKSATIKFAEGEAPATKTTATKTTEHTPAPIVEKVDLDAVRKETIVTTLNAWRDALNSELADPTNPAYKEIMSAMILASGRNADTLFMRKVGKARDYNGKD